VNNRSFQRGIHGSVDAVRHQHRADWHESPSEGLGQHHHVGLQLELVRHQKSSCAEHSGLHLINNEEGAVFAAEFLCFRQIRS